MFRSSLLLPLKFLLYGLALGAALPALAGHESEQDEARRAVQAGQALPFQAVRERVMRYCTSCEILEAKLHEEKEHDRRFLVYEIKAITPDGQVLKLELHAASGEILKVKHKGLKAVEAR